MGISYTGTRSFVNVNTTSITLGDVQKPRESTVKLDIDIAGHFGVMVPPIGVDEVLK